MKFKRLAGLLLFAMLPAAAGIASAAEPGQHPSQHIVKRGDNLWDISIKHFVPLAAIIKANPQIEDPHWIYQGDIIRLPANGAGMKSLAFGDGFGGSGSADPNAGGNAGGNAEGSASTGDVNQEIVRLVNEERAKQGLSALTENGDLSRVALFKSQDMRDQGYFSHDSPSYGSPFDMMKAFNINYSYAGENIAAGQTTPQDVMNSWMNSPGHRKNIMSPDFTEIGIGYCTGGSMNHYWTQQFIKP
ncbi:CAP domain-containing protein [Paenibacillus spongiae]|uniref:CAP domain-containing protein n=1 Tax=Paenibacillus spongiae TaxID=2909671 RepID=A0ABY5SHE4_9BACL|nr:CAP domain-containing protein [Paenibacillus spongiae]UVI31678.1 CAP domain-containing protein [Paenibacillus spongiae]